MKKQFKSILAILCALAMLVTMLPTTVIADETEATGKATADAITEETTVDIATEETSADLTTGEASADLATGETPADSATEGTSAEPTTDKSKTAEENGEEENAVGEEVAGSYDNAQLEGDTPGTYNITISGYSGDGASAYYVEGERNLNLEKDTISISYGGTVTFNLEKPSYAKADYKPQIVVFADTESEDYIETIDSALVEGYDNKATFSYEATEARGYENKIFAISWSEEEYNLLKFEVEDMENNAFTQNDWFRGSGEGTAVLTGTSSELENARCDTYKKQQARVPATTIEDKQTKATELQYQVTEGTDSYLDNVALFVYDKDKKIVTGTECPDGVEIEGVGTATYVFDSPELNDDNIFTLPLNDESIFKFEAGQYIYVNFIFGNKEPQEQKVLYTNNINWEEMEVFIRETTEEEWTQICEGDEIVHSGNVDQIQVKITLSDNVKDQISGAKGWMYGEPESKSVYAKSNNNEIVFWMPTEKSGQVDVLWGTYPFEGEYMISYDDQDGQVRLDQETIAPYAIYTYSTSNTYTFTSTLANVYQVTVSENGVGESVAEVNTEGEYKTFSYTPSTANGFVINIYNGESAYNYDHIDNDFNDENQVIVNVETENGSASLAAESMTGALCYGEKNGAFKAKFNKSDEKKTFYIDLDTEEHYLIEKIIIGNEEYSGGDIKNYIKDGKLVVDMEEGYHGYFNVKIIFTSMSMSFNGFDANNFNVRIYDGNTTFYLEDGCGCNCEYTGTLQIYIKAKEDATFSGLNIYGSNDVDDYIRKGSDRLPYDENTGEYCLQLAEDYFWDNGHYLNISIMDYGYAFDNQFMIYFDDGGVTLDDQILANETVCDFTVGEKLTFAITSPVYVDEPYGVYVYKNEEYSKLTYTDGKAEYTPTDSAAFDVYVIWTEDEFNYKTFELDGLGEGNFLLKYDWNRGDGEGEVTLNTKTGRSAKYGKQVKAEASATLESLQFTIEPEDKNWLDSVYVFVYDENWNLVTGEDEPGGVRINDSLYATYVFDKPELNDDNIFTLPLNDESIFKFEAGQYIYVNFIFEENAFLELKNVGWFASVSFRYDTNKDGSYEDEQWTEHDWESGSRLSYNMDYDELQVKLEFLSTSVSHVSGAKVWMYDLPESETIYGKRICDESVDECILTVKTRTSGEVELIDGIYPYDNEYIVSCDTENKHIYIGTDEGWEEIAQDTVVSYNPGETFRFKVCTTDDEFYGFGLHENGNDEPEYKVVRENNNVIIEYTPRKASGFKLDIFWDVDAYNFEHVYDDFNYDEQLLVRSSGSNGSITLTDECLEDAVIWGRRNNETRAKYNAGSKKTLKFILSADDGAMLRGISVSDGNEYNYEYIDEELASHIDEDGCFWIEIPENQTGEIFVDADFRPCYAYVNGYNTDNFQMQFYNGDSWEDVKDAEVGYNATDEVKFRIKVKRENTTFSGIKLWNNWEDKGYYYKTGSERVTYNEDDDFYYFSMTVEEQKAFYDGCTIEIMDYAHAFANEYVVHFDCFDGAGVRKGKEEILDGCIYTFETGDELSFELVMPTDVSYAFSVEITVDDVDVASWENVTGFSYTPDDNAGFEVYIYWTRDDYNYQHCYDSVDWERASKVELYNDDCGGDMALKDDDVVTRGAYGCGKRYVINKYSGTRKFKFNVTPDEGYMIDYIIINQDSYDRADILSNISENDGYFIYEAQDGEDVAVNYRFAELSRVSIFNVEEGYTLEYFDGSNWIKAGDNVTYPSSGSNRDFRLTFAKGKAFTGIILNPYNAGTSYIPATDTSFFTVSESGENMIYEFTVPTGDEGYENGCAIDITYNQAFDGQFKVVSDKPMEFTIGGTVRKLDTIYGFNLNEDLVISATAPEGCSSIDTVFVSKNGKGYMELEGNGTTFQYNPGDDNTGFEIYIAWTKESANEYRFNHFTEIVDFSKSYVLSLDWSDGNGENSGILATIETEAERTVTLGTVTLAEIKLDNPGIEIAITPDEGKTVRRVIVGDNEYQADILDYYQNGKFFWNAADYLQHHEIVKLWICGEDLAGTVIENCRIFVGDSVYDSATGTLNPELSYAYTGQEIKPEVKVMDGIVDVTDRVSVEYSDNVKTGQARVSIKGGGGQVPEEGKYSGEISASFTIYCPEHSIKHKAAVASTCKTTGNSEYWYCEGCDRYFSDAEGETEIEKDSWVLPVVDHSYSDHVCVWCGKVDEEVKFYLGMTSGNTVDAILTNDYQAVIRLPENSKVSTESVTIKAVMQIMASWGLVTRQHSITINTGLGDREVDLREWLSNAYGFNGGKLNVTVDGNRVTYTLAGIDENGRIVASADTGAAQTVCESLISHVIPSVQAEDDSFIIVANGSYIMMGTEYLRFDDGYEGNLVLDNFNDLDTIISNVRNALYLDSCADQNNVITLFMKAGTVVAVGQTIATLDDDYMITIEVDEAEMSKLDGTFARLRDAEGKFSMTQELVGFVNNVIGVVDASESVEIVMHAHDYTDVTPTFNWDGYKCETATFKCKNCTHTENMDVTVSSTVTTEPITGRKGVRTYTATCTFKGQNYTDIKTEDIPAIDGKIGDVNGNGVINIADAQITYDIACGKYKDHPDYVGMCTRANVNGDKDKDGNPIVDATDARAIQYYVHYGTFEK